MRQAVTTKFKKGVSRGRLERGMTLWLSLVVLVHLATTRPHFGHRLHRRAAVSSSSSSSKGIEAASVCSAECFRRRLAAPLSWNSPPLVNHVRSLMKHPPHRPHAHAPVQSAPARPDGAHEPPERESQRMEEDLVRILDAVSKRGVYIVVGAGGGQRWRRLCEGLQDSGWRGLLVEANARNLAQRWAASHARLHACITYEPRPVARGLWRPFGADLEGISEELRQAQEEHVMLHEYVPDEEKALGTVHNVTCFPLETIVSALRTSTVDLLVLDAPRLADDLLLLSVARRRFLAKVVVVRMTRLLNGQDEGDYLQMADDAGLRLLGWFGEHVVLAHPSVSVYVEVV